MHEWLKVVTQPLGLVSFGLFLVFGYLAKVKRQDERRWLSPVAIALAAVVLIGGLTLAYLQTPKPPPASPVTSSAPPSTKQTNNVKQSSTRAGSPNVQGVQGDVTITVDQSSTNTKGKESAQKKSDQGTQ